MTAKYKLYKNGGVNVCFDDAIPNLFIEGIQWESEVDTLKVLTKIAERSFKGGLPHLTPMDYIEDILKDAAWIVNVDDSPNDTLTNIIDAIGADKKITCIKVLRLLTDCGLKEGKDFVELYFGKDKSKLHDAADELREEFQSRRKEETLGDILESALRKTKTGS